MRSKLLKLALGCAFAAAFVVPALACDYYHTTSAQNEQTVSQSQQQTTPDTPQTAESQRRRTAARTDREPVGPSLTKAAPADRPGADLSRFTEALRH